MSVQDEVDAQVVVLMMRKATSLADFILGSTVRRLLTRLRCDVLVTPASPGSDLAEVQVALNADVVASGCSWLGHTVAIKATSRLTTALLQAFRAVVRVVGPRSRAASTRGVFPRLPMGVANV